jgi:hypothetical protein
VITPYFGDRHVEPVISTRQSTARSRRLSCGTALGSPTRTTSISLIASIKSPRCEMVIQVGMSSSSGSVITLSAPNVLFLARLPSHWFSSHRLHGLCSNFRHHFYLCSTCLGRDLSLRLRGRIEYKVVAKIASALHMLDVEIEVRIALVHKSCHLLMFLYVAT